MFSARSAVGRDTPDPRTGAAIPASVAPTPCGADAHYYLPISNEVAKSGLYVTGVGCCKVSPQQPYPSCEHPALYYFNWRDGRILSEFSLLLITAGDGIFESKATGKMALKRGMAALLFPGVWHRYCPNPEAGWSERWLHFSGQIAHDLWREGIISPERAVFTLPCWKETEAAMCRLLTEIQKTPLSDSALHALRAIDVLSPALGKPVPAEGLDHTPPEQGQDDLLISAAMGYIWSHSHLVLAVRMLAEALKTNRRTLERRMHAVRGHSVLDEIIQCRFTRAERLLRETELPIKTVVDLAAFGSAENMRQVFVLRTGLSPRDYRMNRRVRH